MSNWDSNLNLTVGSWTLSRYSIIATSTRITLESFKNQLTLLERGRFLRLKQMCYSLSVDHCKLCLWTGTNGVPKQSYKQASGDDDDDGVGGTQVQVHEQRGRNISCHYIDIITQTPPPSTTAVYLPTPFSTITNQRESQETSKMNELRLD